MIANRRAGVAPGGGVRVILGVAGRCAGRSNLR